MQGSVPGLGRCMPLSEWGIPAPTSSWGLQTSNGDRRPTHNKITSPCLGPRRSGLQPQLCSCVTLTVFSLEPQFSYLCSIDSASLLLGPREVPSGEREGRQAPWTAKGGPLAQDTAHFPTCRQKIATDRPGYRTQGQAGPTVAQWK